MLQVSMYQDHPVWVSGWITLRYVEISRQDVPCNGLLGVVSYHGMGSSTMVFIVYTHVMRFYVGLLLDG